MEKNYNKKAAPKTGMKERIAELENLLSEKEHNETLIKESYTKEINRLKMAISDHEKTIKAQALEITKYYSDNKALESEISLLKEKIDKLWNRSLWDRIINKDVLL